MFNERIVNWKQIITGFAVFGFILSFITGLIGDVVFGVIILRAFLFAVLFGGISMLIMFLIDAFIPELIDSETDEEDLDFSDAAEIIGDNDSASTSGSKLSGGNLDITIEDDVADEVAPVQDLEELESVEGDSAVESVEELEVVEAADSAIPADLADIAEAAAGGDLPDIGAFAESFDSSGTTDSSDGLSNIDGMESSKSAEIMGGMHDTQELVKAVQTVLKKDQEG